MPTASRGPTFLSFRSEEHTSELQSLTNLVCRLLLEKKEPVFLCPGAGLCRGRRQRADDTARDSDLFRRGLDVFFFFNDRAPPEISPFSLHDALPFSTPRRAHPPRGGPGLRASGARRRGPLE